MPSSQYSNNNGAYSLKKFRTSKMPVIGLYSGPGAELAEDVEKILKNRVPYRIISASEIRHGILEEIKLLIMSGGYTARYIPNLRPQGCTAIRSFLKKKGGCYLGICAGAYIASSSELKIVKSEMVRESGIFNCEIEICDLTHPIFESLENPLLVYYQNGPHILPHKDEKSLALYKDGTTSLLEGKNTLIFSWHPEKLPHTSPILLKSIEYLIH
ncbi:MAG TPA: BPL-N domain-containing protein [Candidatus Deferrimicrobium sp.]|nr:BPL-N domain-containing protein [Candidatus Deferrimicrobium sp.]